MCVPRPPHPHAAATPALSPTNCADPSALSSTAARTYTMHTDAAALRFDPTCPEREGATSVSVAGGMATGDEALQSSLSCADADVNVVIKPDPEGKTRAIPDHLVFVLRGEDGGRILAVGMPRPEREREEELLNAIVKQDADAEAKALQEADKEKAKGWAARLNGEAAAADQIQESAMRAGKKTAKPKPGSKAPAKSASSAASQRRGGYQVQTSLCAFPGRNTLDWSKKAAAAGESDRQGVIPYLHEEVRQAVSGDDEAADDLLLATEQWDAYFRAMLPSAMVRLCFRCC